MDDLEFLNFGAPPPDDDEESLRLRNVEEFKRPKRDLTRSTVLVIPSYAGKILADNLPTLIQLHSQGIEIACISGQSLISRTRSYIATIMLDSGYEEIFWLDDDIIFEEADVWALLNAPEPYRKFLGGLYPKREKNGGWAMMASPQTNRYERYPEVHGIGFGFVLTAREIYEPIQKQMESEGARLHDGTFPFFAAIPLKTGEFYGEDFCFGFRSKQCGTPPRIDPRVVLGHRGDHTFRYTDTKGADPLCDHLFARGTCIRCGWDSKLIDET